MFQVSSSDIANAEKLFGPLSSVAASSLPSYRFFPIMGDGRRKAPVDGKRQQEVGKASGDKIQTELIGRAGLIYVPPEAKQVRKLA